jgi:hypothetical protein
LSKDIELKLLAGIPIEIENVGKLYPLTIRDIALLGNDKFNMYISSLVFDVENLDNYEDNLDKFDDLSTFDVISVYCIHDEKFRNLTIEALNTFFKEEIIFYAKYSVFIVGDIDNKNIINRDNYDDIKYVLRKQYNIAKMEKETHNPANERAKKMIEEIEMAKKDKPKIKPKEKINLHSIISSIAWKSHIGINAIWDLTVYQLYDAFYRLGLIDNYDKIMSGIYAGTASYKYINYDDINWSKIIEFKNS